MKTNSPIISKILNNKATLADQEDALKSSDSAYHFACGVPGADIGRCINAISEYPMLAYYLATRVSANYIEKCQEVVCKDPYCAYLFARDIKGADIGKCLDVCRGTEYEGKLNEVLMEKALL